jgi:adenylate kinase
MGSPGVGKGTQGRRLSALLNIPCISSGDMFREIRKHESDLAREVTSYMDRGAYVPDSLTIQMVFGRLNEPDALVGFILDGFPRTVPQAKALDEKLAQHGRRIDHVVLLDAPNDVVLLRLAGRRICTNCGEVYNADFDPPKIDQRCDVCGGHVEQRADDDPDVQCERLQVYVDNTKPVLAYYKASNRLQVVDATPDRDAVTRELMAIANTPPQGNAPGATATQSAGNVA